MTATASDQGRDRLIAGLLSYGTWLACFLIGAGMLLVSLGDGQRGVHFAVSGYAVETLGVAVFILLPVARVALMLSIFLRERDYLYAAIAAAVLTIIATGVVIDSVK